MMKNRRVPFGYVPLTVHSLGMENKSGQNSYGNYKFNENKDKKTDGRRSYNNNQGNLRGNRQKKKRYNNYNNYNNYNAKSQYRENRQTDSPSSQRRFHKQREREDYDNE